MLNYVPMYVTLYSLDIGEDILLGHDFVKRHMPLIVNIDSLIFIVQQNQVKLPMKSSYIMRVSPETPNILEYSLQDLTKIQKIIRHDDIHGHEFLKDIVQKLRDDCTADFPDAFWTREKYFVSLPYKEGFIDTSQKASANNISPSEQALCQAEIKQLLERHLIEPCKSPWVCLTFYVNKHSEQKRGKKWLVINYKALNSALLPLRYPLPHKELLFSKLSNANVFSKFDLKSGFWQLGISLGYRYKTTFVVPQGQYQWTVMPFSLTNAPSEFQRRMLDSLNNIMS
jgi:hypothetical protein